MLRLKNILACFLKKPRRALVLPCIHEQGSVGYDEELVLHSHRVQIRNVNMPFGNETNIQLYSLAESYMFCTRLKNRKSYKHRTNESNNTYLPLARAWRQNKCLRRMTIKRFLYSGIKAGNSVILPSTSSLHSRNWIKNTWMYQKDI